ncbi:LysR family transcriptional regulator [Rhodobacteraceae bacterium M382]|nr:LysR family transcriptional regulator [Rhodobacteraceae bacterium M382]
MLYLTLRHYEYVTAVAHHGSLSAAAQAVHVSQPALSNALTKVEEHLGYPLFLRRRGAALILTPQGRSFAARAQAVLDQAAQLENAATAPPGLQRLAVGCFADLAPFLLAPALQILRLALPDVSISYRADPFDSMITALLKGDIDLAITYDLGLDAGFHRIELDRVAPHALMSPLHPLAAQGSVTLHELSLHPLVLSQEGLSIQHMLGLFKTHDLLPKVAHRASSLELLRSLAANNEGVGISYSQPPGVISYDGKPLVTIPISNPSAQEPIVLVSHIQTRLGETVNTAQTALAAQLSHQHTASQPIQS